VESRRKNRMSLCGPPQRYKRGRKDQKWGAPRWYSILGKKSPKKISTGGKGGLRKKRARYPNQQCMGPIDTEGGRTKRKKRERSQIPGRGEEGLKGLRSGEGPKERTQRKAAKSIHALFAMEPIRKKDQSLRTSENAS